jgi:predicted amidohydrolase
MSAPPSLTCAVVQLSSQDAVAANLEVARGLVADSVKAGAELVVLPENFAFMATDADKRAHAEDLREPGPIVRFLMESARSHRIHLLGGGFPEKSGDAARPYNTSALFGPDGAVVATYRKIHLFDVDVPGGRSYRESEATLSGALPVVAGVKGVSVGLSVCYDVRFPELYRKLLDAGARVFTVPAAFTLQTGKDHWTALLRARAIENQVYVLAAAQCGTHPQGRATYGKSLIVDPWGDVIAQASDGPGFALARLDFAYQDRVRAAIPCASHRRL